MRTNSAVQLVDVQAIYNGIQAKVYELFMGQQIHVGGLASTLELARAAGVGTGTRGVELCCGTGASMRALLRLMDVESMVGVEAAAALVERGRQTCREQGLDDRIRLVVGDATATDFPDAQADFLWGEDAWCYVVNKEMLVAESVRIIRPGGVIAFTDWIEGPAGLSDAESEHVLQVMTFPSLMTIDGYRDLFERQGCEVVVAEDTGRFARLFELYAEMLKTQLAFDAYEMLAFNTELLDFFAEQLAGFGRLAAAGKLGQLRLVAKRPT